MATVTGNGQGTKVKDFTRLTKSQLLEVVNSYDHSMELFEERFLELELALEDEGWKRLTWDMGQEVFSRDGILKIIELSRAAYLANPLIRHAVNVQANYVFAQGVAIHGKPTDEVNETLQAFWDLESNQKVLTDPFVLWNREVQLATEGNLFVVFFPNPLTGEVQVRFFPPEEFIRGGDPICNPEDRDEVWFYKRVWDSYEYNPVGASETALPLRKHHEAYYPAWDYNPGFKRETINGKEVRWTSPVYHVKVGNIAGQFYGVPEVYSALAWARAVKLDLEDYATIRRALSRFAWNLRVEGGREGVAQAKSKLESAVTHEDVVERNPAPVAGSTFIGAEGRDMQPMRLAGTTLNPEEGRRLWLMVSAATGIPETILAGNADVGNLATARTLDRPTELQMRMRQTLWKGILTRIGNYVLRQSALSVAGALTGDVIGSTLELQVRRAQRGRPVFDTNKAEVSIVFPSILEPDKDKDVRAIVRAFTMEGRALFPGLVSVKDLQRRLLVALGEDDVDGAVMQILAELEEEPDQEEGGEEPNGQTDAPPEGEEEPSDAIQGS